MCASCVLTEMLSIGRFRDDAPREPHHAAAPEPLRPAAAGAQPGHLTRVAHSPDAGARPTLAPSEGQYDARYTAFPWWQAVLHRAVDPRTCAGLLHEHPKSLHIMAFPRTHIARALCPNMRLSCQHCVLNLCAGCQDDGAAGTAADASNGATDNHCGGPEATPTPAAITRSVTPARALSGGFTPRRSQAGAMTPRRLGLSGDAQRVGRLCLHPESDSHPPSDPDVD